MCMVAMVVCIRRLPFSILLPRGFRFSVVFVVVGVLLCYLLCVLCCRGRVVFVVVGCVVLNVVRFMS